MNKTLFSVEKQINTILFKNNVLKYEKISLMKLIKSLYCLCTFTLFIFPIKIKLSRSIHEYLFNVLKLKHVNNIMFYICFMYVIICFILVKFNFVKF